MKILALEFSSPRRSVAVWDAASGVGVEAVDAASGPAMQPFRLIAAALRDAALEREQIECVAVGLGPGSYTGIRAAIALAQGWQLARRVPVTGVSSVDCLAADAVDAGLRGTVHVVIDAQRGEGYLAGYELASDRRHEISPLRIVSLEAIRAEERRGATLIGPEVSKWFPSGRVLYPHAATLARLAGERAAFLPGNQLEPIYLRETAFVKAPPPRRFPA